MTNNLNTANFSNYKIEQHKKEAFFMYYEMTESDALESKSGRGLSMSVSADLLRKFAQSEDSILTITMLPSSNMQKVYSSLYSANKLDENGSSRIIDSLRIRFDGFCLRLYKSGEQQLRDKSNPIDEVMREKLENK